MRLKLFIIVGTLILGNALFFSASRADDFAIKTDLMIKSIHPDGSTSQSKMEIVASTAAEMDANIQKFVSMVGVAPEDPEDETIVGVSRYNSSTNSYDLLSGR